MTFRDVIGHELVRHRLAEARRRPAHAYLFHGADGIGKRAVADAFAMLLFCEHATDDACGTCRQCTRAAAGTHPDAMVLTRDEDRRDIRIEQARSLVRWLTLTPMMATRKVALIDGAHLLNEHGQNALLKTLEEPPGPSVVVLIATRTSQLLPTIRSRCHAVGFGPLAVAEVAAALEARGVPAAKASVVAAQAEGSLGRALALAATDQTTLRDRVLDVLGSLRSRPAHEISALAQEVARAGPGAALDVSIAWYRDLLAHACGVPALAHRHPDRTETLAAAATSTTPAIVLRQLERLCDTIVDLERNANRVLAVETMLLALRRLDRLASAATP